MAAPPLTVTTPLCEATLPDASTVQACAAMSSIAVECDSWNRPCGRFRRPPGPTPTGRDGSGSVDPRAWVKHPETGAVGISRVVNPTHVHHQRAGTGAPCTVGGVTDTALPATPRPAAPPTVWCPGPPPVPDWAAVGPTPARRQRRLPPWLPAPVLLFAPFAVAEPLAAAAVFPSIGVAAVVVAAAVGLVIRWVSKGGTTGAPIGVAGVGWGATVAVTIAVAAAQLVAAGASHVDDVTYITVLGPFVEEFAKAGFVLWALWRLRGIGTVIDGIVAAWWCAVGFAFVENIGYFYDAEITGNLAAVVVVRGVASPFAHLLFATVVGAAAGWAATRCWGKRRTAGAVGVAAIAASFIHGAWNRVAYTASLAEPGGGELAAIGASAIGFAVMFWVLAAAVAVTRDAERRRLAVLTTAAVDAHPSLAGLEARDVARYATLATAQVDPVDEGERQVRLRHTLRHARRRHTATAAGEGSGGGE